MAGGKGFPAGFLDSLGRLAAPVLSNREEEK
jgi:hypothetical protein